jgi:hypothetical protein
MQIQGNKMQRRAGGREDTMKDLCVGTVVSIRLEKVDRGRTDFGRLPGVVIGITEHQQYRIGVKGGRLKVAYRRSDLIVEESKTALCYDGLSEVLSVDWKSLKELSLRQANEKVSLVGGQGMLHCGCKGNCLTERCACRKVGHFCNSRCHASNSKCGNIYCDENAS